VKVVAQLLCHVTLTTTSPHLDELPGELSVAVNTHPHPCRVMGRVLRTGKAFRSG